MIEYFCGWLYFYDKDDWVYGGTCIPGWLFLLALACLAFEILRFGVRTRREFVWETKGSLWIKQTAYLFRHLPLPRLYFNRWAMKICWVLLAFSYECERASCGGTYSHPLRKGKLTNSPTPESHYVIEHLRQSKDFSGSPWAINNWTPFEFPQTYFS